MRDFNPGSVIYYWMLYGWPMNGLISTFRETLSLMLDSLMERLREKRVQRVIEPVLRGDGLTVDPMEDDYQYVLDLGLLRQEGYDTVVTNAIYREVMPRYLNAITEEETALPRPGDFACTDGSLRCEIWYAFGRSG